MPGRTPVQSTLRDDVLALLRERRLLVLLGLGFLLRVLVAALVRPDLTATDGAIYASGASVLRVTGELDTGYVIRPPLYFVFLAAVQSLTGRWVVLTTLLQCAAGTAAAIPVAWTARRLAGMGAAQLAAAFLLLDPTLISYCHLLGPETFYLLLAAIAFDAAARVRPGAWRSALGLGLLAGLAMLIKPAFGLFALLCGGGWVLRFGPRAGLRLALVLGVAAALVISPQLVRNQLRYGAAVGLENEGRLGLWMGNDMRPARIVRGEFETLPNAEARSRVALERGLAAIGEDPSGFARRFAVRALNLWGLEFFVLRAAVFGGYGDVSKQALLLVFWTLQAAYAAQLLLAAAGARRLCRDPGLRPALAFAAGLTLLVAATVGSTRSRVPLTPLLAVAAGVGAGRLLEGRIRLRDLAAVGLALVALGLSASRPLFGTVVWGSYSDPSALRNSEWQAFRY
jgi:4-amino-4-deoxy-L-arabinose transferase-like glycosyltransferase